MHVVLATDGSDNARVATEWLIGFPLPPATKVLVLAVVAAPPAAIDVAIPPELDDAAHAAARQAADAAAELSIRRWHETTVRVLEGDPRETIPRIASDWGADLVVVGARGLGAMKRFFLGSVSTAVVHQATCAVLVVKPRPRGLSNALVAVDGSGDSLAAARFFAGLPLDPALGVRLLGVVERPYAPRTAPRRISGIVAAAIEQIVIERRAELERALATIRPEFEMKVPKVETSVALGAPADEIIAAARGADLVVLGARGLGTIERLLIGSVSERVLHHAPCSVLIVKGRPAEGREDRPVDA
jgi:nucleotide-binding universal stress UspA family protein